MTEGWRARRLPWPHLAVTPTTDHNGLPVVGTACGLEVAATLATTERWRIRCQDCRAQLPLEIPVKEQT